jgi:hypothetical protein
MVTKSHARAAACTAVAIIAVGAGIQFYWGLGGTWDGEAALSASDQIRSVVIGLAGLAYAGILLVRAGYWHEHLPSAVARIADIPAWLVVMIPLGGAASAFEMGAAGNGVGNLIIAALAFVVARGERPLLPGSRGAATAGGRPGPATSAR